VNRIPLALMVGVAVSILFFLALFAGVKDGLGWALIIGMFAGAPMAVALVAGLVLTDVLARRSGWRNLFVYALLPALTPFVLLALYLLSRLAKQPHGLPEDETWSHWLRTNLSWSGALLLPLIPGGLAGGVVLYLRRDEA
jgi:hypothetical protein